MKVLVTGAAGFIGYHVTQALLTKGYTVIGFDNLNPYYDPQLKQARLKKLEEHSRFSFIKGSLEDRQAIENLGLTHPDLTYIIHLAAQAGVRYSLIDPTSYAQSNLLGHLNMLELCRRLTHLKHFVYASSSSVYGNNEKLPFSVEDRVDTPISLYAATKKSNELMSYAYSHLFQIPSTGLRFFTVYGPWGRPDMSAFIFTKAILNQEEMPVYNQGQMKRNYTYVDDIVAGTIACMLTPPQPREGAPSAVYNLGNNRSENLLDFIALIENKLNLKARIRFEPLQPGDVKETIADITPATLSFGFTPQTNIETGLSLFIEWYREYYHV